jgi:hypothetical protein
MSPETESEQLERLQAGGEHTRRYALTRNGKHAGKFLRAMLDSRGERQRPGVRRERQRHMPGVRRETRAQTPRDVLPWLRASGCGGLHMRARRSSPTGLLRRDHGLAQPAQVLKSQYTVIL